MSSLLILSRRAAEYQALLEAAQLPGLEITARTRPPEAGDWELAFGEPNLLAEALPRLPQLRWMQATWAGVEPLLAPGLRRDYLLTNARGVFGAPMAEYVFAYLLAHERRLLARWQNQQAGRWDPAPPGRLRGKTLGLLGVGSIGARVAAAAKHFEMRVRGYTRASAGCPDVDAYYHGAQLLEFARGLDYLVAVLPNTAGTRRLVDAELLAGLPPHAVVVNVGRGATLDEAALEQAVRAGRLAAAVLDVFEHEPLPADSLLWTTPNVFITSHTSALTHPPDMLQLFCDNYRRWRAGEPLLHRVDFELGY